MIELIHCHIPKTGGVSFLEVLKSIYKEEEIAYPWTWMGVAPESRNGRDLLWNHWDSLYKEWQEKIPEVVAKKPHIKVLQGHFPVGLFKGLFPEAKRICFVRHPIARVISHFFHDMKNGYQPGMSLGEYIRLPYNRNIISFHIGHWIDNMDWVGVLEYINKDIPELVQLLNWKHIPDVPKLNVGGYEHGNFFDQGKKIAEMNEQDMNVVAEVLARKAWT